MLTSLEHAKKHGAKIIAINPLPEPGFLRFNDPNPDEYKTPLHFAAHLLGPGDPLADLHLPVRINGDIALLKGLMKVLLAEDAVDGRRLRSRLHPRLHRRLRGAVRRPRGDELAGHRGRVRPLAGGDRARRADDRPVEADDRVLGDGPHPAPRRGGHHPHAGQPAPARRPHRPAGRRDLLCPRPLQRPGRPHHGHLGAAAGGVPRRAGPRVRLQVAAESGTRHGGHDRRDARGRDRGLRLAGRQLPLGHARHRLYGGGAATVSAHRAHRHQAQPLAPGRPAGRRSSCRASVAPNRIPADFSRSRTPWAW